MRRLWSLILALLIFCTACGQQEQGPTWKSQYDLGIRYLSEGDYEEARLAFETAIEIDPKQADAYIGLAAVYLSTGQTDKAEEILREALSVVDDTTSIMKRLGDMDALSSDEMQSQQQAETEEEPEEKQPEDGETEAATQEKTEQTDTEERIVSGHLPQLGNDPGNINRTENTLAFDDDYIYFTDIFRGNREAVYRIRYDGTGKEKISNSYDVSYINVYEGNLYYCSGRLSINLLNPETFESKVLYKGEDLKPTRMLVAHGKLFCSVKYEGRDAVGVLMIDLQTNDSTWIYSRATKYEYVEIAADTERIYLMSPGESSSIREVVIVDPENGTVSEPFESQFGVSDSCVTYGINGYVCVGQDSTWNYYEKFYSDIEIETGKWYARNEYRSSETVDGAKHMSGSNALTSKFTERYILADKILVAFDSNYDDGKYMKSFYLLDLNDLDTQRLLRTIQFSGSEWYEPSMGVRDDLFYCVDTRNNELVCIDPNGDITVNAIAE